MIINHANLAALFTGFKTSFEKGMTEAKSQYRDVATVVPSSDASNTYGWLGQLPSLREWLGERIVKNLSVHAYAIANKDFESTVSVSRNHIEDDKFGVYGPAFTELGRAAATHPDVLVFSLLAAGFATPCYDGQYFFDADHPVGDRQSAPVSVSNVQAGDGSAWFLLDTSRAIKPVIFQERRPYKLVKLDSETDPNVFWHKEYVYGVDGRANAGFGLWQLAYASKADFTAANYEAARAAMAEFKGDEGRPLGIQPDTIVVPSSLEGAARRLLKNGTRVEIVGETPVPVANEWADSAKLIISPWLA